MKRFVSLWLPHWATDLHRRSLARDDPSYPAPPALPAQHAASGGAAGARGGARGGGSASGGWSAAGGRRLTRRATPPLPPPIILTRTVAQRKLIARACPIAQRYGIRPGIDLTLARAMLPAPLAAATFVAEHRPLRDEHALVALARWAALRFTPLVATDVADASHVGMDGLLLDISGCEHLFGGDLALISVLLRKARKHGLTCAAAVAPTPAAAWALARYGPAQSPSHACAAPLRDQLAPLPLAALRLAPTTLEALARVGLFRIGEVLALPRASLPVRFGPELLLHLDQALGQAMHPLVPVTVPQPLRTTLPFSGPTTNYEAVMLAVRTTLSTLCELLQHRALGTRLLRLRLHRVDAPPVDFLIRLSAPSHDPAHLWALLRSAGEGIENAHLGFGVEGVTVISLRSGPVQEHQRAIALTSLAANSQTTTPLTLTTHTPPTLPPQLPSPPLPPPAELIDQLATRLGADRVLFPALISSHLPESSSALTRAMEAAETSTSGPSTSGPSTSPENPSITRHLPRARPRPRVRPNKSALASPPLADLTEPAASSAHRPPRLFEKAEPALVVALVPDGPPVRITWRDCEHTVLCALGPEHLKEAWWSAGSSCDLALRQYFRVQLDDGRWLFVLRRQDAPPRSATRWFVHGIWC